jgi:hypothetical protein
MSEENMAPEKPRRFGAIQHARELIIAELERPDIPQEQRSALLHDLTELQLDISKKWNRRKVYKKPPTGRKPGRPRKSVDSEGNPLYNDSIVPPKADDTESKKKFLSGIQGNEPDSTEIQDDSR